MSKNKKRKIVSLKPAQLSPENYIKANARSLPIVECLINSDWESVGICHIVIARAHKNGNLTVGNYLVDIYCLGVKDADYQFNIPPEEYEELKHEFADWEECEYVLAHNIVYGAVAFAEDYGFKPHKDFSIAQYILEEDDERVELMEIEFGLDGKPFYARGPYDDDSTINRIKNTLMRTAGEGNFTVAEDTEFDDGEFDDEIMDDEFGEDEDVEELVNYFAKEKAANFKSFAKVFNKVNKTYDKFMRTPEEIAALQQSSIGKGYKISDIEPGDKFDSIEEEDEFDRLNNLIMNEDEYGPVIKEILDAIEKYPECPAFYNELQLAYAFGDQFDEADETTEKAYKLFPDYLPAKIRYATLLIDSERLDEVLPVFNGKTDLGEIYPDRKAFNTAGVVAYYACMCRYFIAIGDIDSADRYMNVIIKKDYIKIYGQLVLDVAMQEMCKAKMDKMDKVIDQSKS